MNYKKRTLLHIEDNASDRLLFKDLLLELNPDLAIRSCYDGSEAIQTLSNTKNGLPDIIILDLNLPKIKGNKVLSWIKQEEKLRHIPVIILSTSAMLDEVLFCYQNHANTYFQKPKDYLEYNDLIKIINDHWLSASIVPTYF